MDLGHAVEIRLHNKTIYVVPAAKLRLYSPDWQDILYGSFDTAEALQVRIHQALNNAYHMGLMKEYEYSYIINELE